MLNSHDRKRPAAAGGGYSVVQTGQQKTVPVQVADIIGQFLRTAQYGYIILTMQDNCVVKIEKTEKFIISAKAKVSGCGSSGQADPHPFLAKIIAELREIHYGQLIVRLENGKVEQMERTEKKRVQEVDGRYGDGI
ncbi:MAG: DUF2292 domain-containing protein [Sporomusaceae bacterium]|nr:DUF2292 domain-containing protein [Sporomusaceae bacterium]